MENVIVRSRILRVLSLGLATLVAAVVLPSAPAQAAWGTTVNVNIQVGSPFGNLGKVTGTIQFETNTTQFRYNLTFCRQSSYMLPYLEVRRNWVSGSSTFVTYIYPTWTGGTSSCPNGAGSASGTVTTGTIRDLYLILYGSTFGWMGEYLIYDEDQFLDSPYA
jgi:hypothetical protein